MDERQPDVQPSEFSLNDLSVGVLEEILADLMAVKYPGVEQEDINHLLAALNSGDLSLAAQVEADIAEKSARWMSAILDMDG